MVLRRFGSYATALKGRYNGLPPIKLYLSLGQAGGVHPLLRRGIAEREAGDGGSV
jgi:hypothetical protein